MLPRMIRLHPSTYQRLIRLSKEAERDGAYRVSKRLQAVVLNSQGRSSGELAAILQAPRSKVSEWLARYQAHGVEGLLEGQRCGRPPLLSSAQRQPLRDIREAVFQPTCPVCAHPLGVLLDLAPFDLCWKTLICRRMARSWPADSCASKSASTRAWDLP